MHKFPKAGTMLEFFSMVALSLMTKKIPSIERTWRHPSFPFKNAIAKNGAKQIFRFRTTGRSQTPKGHGCTTSKRPTNGSNFNGKKCMANKPGFCVFYFNCFLALRDHCAEFFCKCFVELLEAARARYFLTKKHLIIFSRMWSTNFCSRLILCAIYSSTTLEKFIGNYPLLSSQVDE